MTTPTIPLSSLPLTETTAVTVGMFDGVHLGHRQIVSHLIAAARQRNIRPVVVTFDHHPRQTLGRTGADFGLLCDTNERMARLRQCGDVEIVVLPFNKDLAQLSACQFLRQVLSEKLHAGLLLLGYDNQFGNRGKDDFARLPEVADELGITLVRDTPVELQGGVVSSTRIRKTLSAGDVALASQMLGESYTLEGEVVAGRGEGRKLGFPTANIKVSPERMIPRKGVYGVAAQVDGGEVFPGVANLGESPTFDVSETLLEVHLISEAPLNLYGHCLKVSFKQWLRDIERFESTDGLQRQIAKDVANARDTLTL